jgi:hypothetical protein
MVFFAAGAARCAFPDISQQWAEIEEGFVAAIACRTDHERTTEHSRPAPISSPACSMP